MGAGADTAMTSGGGAIVCIIVALDGGPVAMVWIMLMVGCWAPLKEDMATASLVARGIIMGEREEPIPGGKGVA